jgi:uncharacterized protein
MGQPVVHFEVIGRDPAKLRDYYGRLFGWQFDTGGPVAAAASAAGRYGFLPTGQVGDVVGIPGGVGGGEEYERRVTFYVAVPDVEAALRRAESLGGTRRAGPEQAPGSELVIGHFTDPEGNLIGVAGIR